MSNHTISHAVGSKDLKRMIQTAAGWLEENKEIVDRMNVFPVPDGDTGTNMALTMQSAERFASKVQSEAVGPLVDQMAYGALMGARGNSGVILSQILSGMATVLRTCETVSPGDFSKAMTAGAEAAYNAVTNPMEGTILTVVREVGEHLARARYDSLESCLESGIAAGRESLSRTPELLPVLKQAGVVDAGGQGFIFILEGMLRGLQGAEIEISQIVIPSREEANVFDHFFESPEEILYPYCTEFLIQTGNTDLDPVIQRIRDHFARFGDSMLVVGAGETVKVHIHTDRLGDVLGYASSFGELDDIKINNMRSQHKALQTQTSEATEAEVGVVVVSNGDGFNNIFKSLGVGQVIYGGQTMNPSTEDFLNAIDDLGARHIFILPNNKNIILTAQQAAELTQDHRVHVIPTRTIPQGISAMLRFSPLVEDAENVAEMEAGMAEVISGEITSAVRDTQIDQIDIREGQYMAIVDGKIIAATDDLQSALSRTVQVMEKAGKELITLYHSTEVTEDAHHGLLNGLEAAFPDLEFEDYPGGQSVYDYIVSAE